MSNYIFSLYLSLERFLCFGDDYKENDNDYIEENKIILDNSKHEIQIVSPIKIDPEVITKEHVFVAKY